MPGVVLCLVLGEVQRQSWFVSNEIAPQVVNIAKTAAKVTKCIAFQVLGGASERSLDQLNPSCIFPHFNVVQVPKSPSAHTHTLHLQRPSTAQVNCSSLL